MAIGSDSATGTWLENVGVCSPLAPFHALLLWGIFMPSFTPLIVALWFSYLTTQGRADSRILVNDLLRQCAFDLNGYGYNLCPLLGPPKVVDVPEEAQDGRTSSGPYLLALGGLGKGNGCNEETWVCSTTRTSEPEPVVQKDKSSNLIFELRGNLDHDPPQLQMTLHGANKDLDIVMLCSEVEQVQLITVGDDTLRFMWASRYGCPRNSTRRESTLNILTDGEEGPNGEDHEGGDHDELVPSDSRKARRSIAFVIAVIILGVISCSALASSARARHFALELLRKASYAIVPVLANVGLKLRPVGQSLTSLTSKAMSGVRFRPGGDNLVLWAQEEMALESDIMVNGSGRAQFDEESWDGSDEYIPLTRSPRFGKGGRIPSYGSTPDGPMVQEGALMSRMKRYLKI